MDFLLVIFAFALGAVGGVAITERDPVSGLLNSVRRRGIRLAAGSLGVGFAAGILWQILGPGH